MWRNGINSHIQRIQFHLMQAQFLQLASWACEFLQTDPVSSWNRFLYRASAALIGFVLWCSFAVSLFRSVVCSVFWCALPAKWSVRLMRKIPSAFTVNTSLPALGVQLRAVLSSLRLFMIWGIVLSLFLASLWVRCVITCTLWLHAFISSQAAYE